MERLSSISGLVVSQQKEWGEILTGFETKNKYAISEVTDYTAESFYQAFNGISGWKCIFIKNDYLQWLE